MTDVRTFALDLVERAAWTFGQAAAPVLLAANLSDYSELHAALTAAAVAGGAVKGIAAGVRTGTASTSVKVSAYTPEHARPQP